MSLYELMTCSKKDGGCGHARHRHTRTGGSVLQAMKNGGCRAVGSEGRCACQRFVERKEGADDES